jgi:hypothetical protein
MSPQCKNRTPLSRITFLRILTYWTIAVLGACALPALRSSPAPMVITWGGNSADWNRALHVSGIRIGCSDAPASCLREVDKVASDQHVSSVFLAIVLNPSRLPSDAATYASMAQSHPALKEVGFDDFVSQAEKSKLPADQLSSVLLSFAQTLKSHSSVGFGITVYENQFSNGEVEKLRLSPELRQQIDVVHLFPHFRKQNQAFSAYVEKSKQIFPNSKVILGVYAYDRREYIPCAQGDSHHCSDQEEVNLFSQLLKQDLDLAQSGAVQGLEFYPGSFGLEDSWKHWDNPRFCKPEERDECIRNTKTMREQTRQAMESLR